MPLFQIPKKKHIELLGQANVCDHYEYSEFKREHFYPFKTRFLRRYGFFDGYDKQILINDCWRCMGTGEVLDYAPCGKCGGSGVYSRREIYLERRRVHGRLFHIPVDVVRLPCLINPPTNTYTDRIKHEQVDPEVARKAALKIILLYEVETFLMMKWREVKSWLDRAFEERGRMFKEMILRKESQDEWDDLPF